MPSYMANTQSSRAKKVRSQSEPKQRPDGSNKHKSKHADLVYSTDEQFLRHSSSQIKNIDQKNYDPWFGKLYRPRRLYEDNKYDYINPSHSKYNESLASEVKTFKSNEFCRFILINILLINAAIHCVFAAPCDFVLIAPGV